MVTRVLPPCLPLPNNACANRDGAPNKAATITKRKLPNAVKATARASAPPHSVTTTTGTNDTSASAGLFASCRFVIELGENISSKRRKLWADQIAKHAGTITDALTKHTTHVILPTPFTHWHALTASVKQKNVERMHFHSDEWLVQSLKLGRVCDDDRFVITVPSSHTIIDDSDNQSLMATMNEHDYDSEYASMPQLTPEPSSSLSFTSIASSSLLSSPASLPELETLESPAKTKIDFRPNTFATVAANTNRTLSFSINEPKAKGEGKSTESSIVKQEEDTHTDSKPSKAARAGDVEWLIDPAAVGVNGMTEPVLKPHPYHSARTHFLTCQQSSLSLVNHNAAITDVLERLEAMNEAMGDKWRTYSYRKAVGIIKQYPKRIETEQDFTNLLKIRGISVKMIEKIREIIESGTLKKMRVMEDDERIKTLEKFIKIYGVGGATAAKWYGMGLRTLEQIVTDPRIVLTPQQRVGLRFYEDKLKRIPRSEVKAIQDYVWMLGESLMPGLTLMACGSYRRGKPSSGDVDLLVTHPHFTHDGVGKARREQFFHVLLEKLKGSIVPPYPWVGTTFGTNASGHITINDSDDDNDTDTNTERSGEPRVKKWKADLPTHYPPFVTGVLSDFDQLTARHAQATFMGFCCLPESHPQYSGLNRRLDIKIYPRSMFPFALLYFTGSDHFNRSMRFYAKKLGWTLSDHGLTPANRRVKGSTVWTGTSIECQSEKDIFNAMGLTYIPPTERNTYQGFEKEGKLTPDELQAIKQEEREDEEKKTREMFDEGGASASGCQVLLSDGGSVKLQPEELYIIDTSSASNIIMHSGSRTSSGVG